MSTWLYGRESAIQRDPACSFDPLPNPSHGVAERAYHLQLIRSERRRVFCVIRPGNWDDRRPEEYHENTLLMVGGMLVKDEKRNGYIWLEDAGRIAACDVVADSGKRQ